MEKKAITKKTWIIIGAAVVLLAALGVGVFIFSQGGAGREESLLDLGQRYLEEMNYEQAIVCFEEYLEIDPKSVEAYAGLAESYAGLGEYEKALEVLAEGYAVTGNESLQELSKQYEEQYAETLASANAGAENDAAVSEEAAHEDGPDPRFEACVVDGIYHNGYEYYDLTSEEETFLQSIIDQAQQENIDEVFSLLEGDAFVDLFRNHDAYTENIYVASGNIHIAFHRFKIYCKFESSSTLSSGEITIIPLDEGTGYYFSRQQSDYMENTTWLVSDCKNGMFDGQFVKYLQLETPEPEGFSLEVSTGNAINGLLDGTVIRHISYSNNESWRRSDYVLGQVKVFKEAANSDGSTTYYYEYAVDENGEPILSNGDYAGTVGFYSTKEEMETKRWWIGGAFGSSGREREGGMYYYPY